jgi:hypothetical protein
VPDGKHYPAEPGSQFADGRFPFAQIQLYPDLFAHFDANPSIPIF